MGTENGSNAERSALPQQQRYQAALYIKNLTGAEDAKVTIQTFLDQKEDAAGNRKTGSAPVILNGTLDEHLEQLVRLNDNGHGVFIMVNEGDLKGRRAENVVGLRAVFTDDDEGKAKPFNPACPPSFVVRSKRGLHRYWVLMPGEPMDRFTLAQEHLARFFGTDPKIKDLPRVMRLPGFFHMKDPNDPFLVTVEEVVR